METDRCPLCGAPKPTDPSKTFHYNFNPDNWEVDTIGDGESTGWMLVRKKRSDEEAD
jgi:hypothetical protein